MEVSGINSQNLVQGDQLLAARTVPAPGSETTGIRKEAAPSKEAASKPPREHIKDKTDIIEEDAGNKRAGTRLHIDKASKRIIAQIINQNNEVIKQIPPEDALKIAARFIEINGKIFDLKI
jgi:uncharacterized FlaG/YvyC family protein